MTTSQTRLKACDHCILRSLIGQKGWDHQVHLTVEGEGLGAQRKFHGWKFFMDSYMEDSK